MLTGIWHTLCQHLILYKTISDRKFDIRNIRQQFEIVEKRNTNDASCSWKFINIHPQNKHHRLWSLSSSELFWKQISAQPKISKALQGPSVTLNDMRNFSFLANVNPNWIIEKYISDGEMKCNFFPSAVCQLVLDSETQIHQWPFP